MRGLGKSVLTVLAIAAMPAVAYGASPVDQSVNINADVGHLCILGTPNPASVDLGVLAETSGTSVGHLQTIANHTVQLPASFCNYAGTEMTVDASALLASDTSPVETGWTRAVNYTATVSDWGSSNASTTTAAAADGTNPDSTGSSGTQNTPRLTDLTLTLSSFTAPGDGYLVAGGYQGSVTITVGPAS